ncbi:LOW QUALITY PROTEIN: hypothetical protein HID58_022213, partial [Brassica napus]
KEWNVAFIIELLRTYTPYLVSCLYTVKSGYAIAVEQRRTRQPVEVKEPSTNASKTEVWKLKAPRKMKHFLCTASILPRLVWYIWNRNDKCFNNKDTSAYSSWLFKSTMNFGDMKKYETRQQSHMFQHTAGSVKWMLHESDNGAGLGFILLDGDTNVITGTRKRGQAKSPIHAEVESLLWAMEEVSGRGFQQKNCSSSGYIPRVTPTKIVLLRYTFQAEVHAIWRERNSCRHGEQPRDVCCLIKLWTKQCSSGCFPFKEKDRTISKRV